MDDREALKGFKVPVLDHGHVILLDFMGCDADIVDAARTSYQKGTKHVSDKGTLLKYLFRHRHSTPFESVVVKFHIKLPIVIERQFARHRTAGWSEVSGRYSELPEECYQPDEEDVCFQSEENRQGRQGQVGKELYEDFIGKQQAVQKLAFENYHDALNAGIARETARNSLPLSTYTEKVWWINIHNMFHFLGLRMDSHAQKEIRDYATAIGQEFIAKLFPNCWEAFVDYRLNALTLHGQEIATVAKAMATWFDDVSAVPSRKHWLQCIPEAWKLPKCRERDEFFVKLIRLGLLIAEE